MGQADICDIIDSCDDYLLRSNETAHFTASAWVVKYDRTGSAYFITYIQSAWTWTGGHAEKKKPASRRALREVRNNGFKQYKACEQGDFFFNRG